MVIARLVRVQEDNRGGTRALCPVDETDHRSGDASSQLTGARALGICIRGMSGIRTPRSRSLCRTTEVFTSRLSRSAGGLRLSSRSAYRELGSCRIEKRGCASSHPYRTDAFILEAVGLPCWTAHQFQRGALTRWHSKDSSQALTRLPCRRSAMRSVLCSSFSSLTSVPSVSSAVNSVSLNRRSDI